MKQFTSYLLKQSKGLRNSHFEKTGVNSYIKSNQDWILKQKDQVNQMKRVQQQIYQTELAKNSVVKAVVNVVTEYIPKTIKTMVLKLTIHMQMLVGNTFGIKMRGLEENKQKLHRMQNPSPIEKDESITVETNTVDQNEQAQNKDSDKLSRAERFATAFQKEKTPFDPNTMIQKKKDQATNGLSRMNSNILTGVQKIKNAVVSALDSAISSLRKLLTKAKTVASKRIPTIKKVKGYLATAKDKITSINSVTELKQTIVAAYVNAKQKVSNIKQNGFKSLLEPLRKKLDKIFNRRTEQKKVVPESKVWKAAFGMSKQEVIERASEDFRQYMTGAHFNIGQVKKSLLAFDQTGLTHKNSRPSTLDWALAEFNLVKQYTMNTVYNFYSEGVLNRFVLKLKSGEENSIFDSTRARIYLALFSTIVVFALWQRRRPQSAVDVTDNQNDPNSETSVKLRLLQLEIEKVKLQIEVQKLRQQ